MKISLGTGGNQDPVEQYKQKIALLQNCSRPLQFSGGFIFDWTAKVFRYWYCTYFHKISNFKHRTTNLLNKIKAWFYIPLRNIKMTPENWTDFRFFRFCMVVCLSFYNLRSKTNLRQYVGFAVRIQRELAGSRCKAPENYYCFGAEGFSIDSFIAYF